MPDKIPPGPKGKPIAGNLLEFRRNPTGFLLNAALEYGDVVYLKFGPQQIYLINNPDYIRDVLVTNNRNFIKSRGLQMARRFLGEGLLTSEGDLHRRQRRLAQPAFHKQRINSYADVMAEYAARARDRWDNGETLDIHREMMQVTLGIVGKTLFGADVESEAQEIGEALNAIMKLFDRITIPFPQLMNSLPLPSNYRFLKAHRRLDKTIYRIIGEHRAAGIDRGDLLSMLLLAQDEEGDGGSMTDVQLRDEAMTIFLAGHETTANAMTWTWYLLSENPEIEEKLHREIDEVLEGRLPAADDVPQLRYTEMIFAESMRMYPPAWAMGRQVLSDYEVGGYVAPAESIILMSPWVMHHNPRYYPDPLRFDPERWTPQNREARPKFCYFPFGGGPRVCIGEGFAWMEGVLLLAAIAQRWQMRLEAGHRVEMRPLITLRPKYGMRMTVRSRQ